LGGGYPGGRIVEIYGQEGTGKTTLLIHAMMEAQKRNRIACIMDAERGWSEDYANAIGLQGKANERYLKEEPEYGEQCIEMVLKLLSTDDPPLVIGVDSVAALTPKAELEGDVGEAFMGLQARMMGQAMRKLVAAVYSAGTVLIFINQVRSKIGVFFGSPNTTTGGKALAFYASQRLELSAGDQFVDKDKTVTGRYIKAKTIKNKVAMPFRTCQVPLRFGLGIDHAKELFDSLLLSGKIVRKTSWYVYGEEKLGLGEENAVATIAGDINKWEELNDTLKA
jgi:recombination protein RecA